MIVDLPNTTVSKVSKSLVQIREQGGAVALGRVLTLIISTDFKGIETARLASIRVASWFWLTTRVLQRSRLAWMLKFESAEMLVRLK
ncbi:MAG: hypothetical protein RI974_701 [Actinomycetota bacterium]